MACVDQSAAPLFEGLASYLAGGWTGFHTPGHTGGRAFDLTPLPALDLTEVPLWPGGPLPPFLVDRAEALAAEFFGAGRTFFLTNGASQGVLAMLLGTCPEGGKILVGRDCHRSVVNACVIGDLRPIFLPPSSLPGWGFPIGVSTVQLREALAGGWPVVATNPTYQGVVWDLGALGAAGGTLLVDEAHGTHLALPPEPRGARAARARSWVHGCHKTLGSLTQTGLLHLEAGIAPEPYAAWLEWLGSTSPSYPLLASLDLARRWAAMNGRESWARAAERLDGLRERLILAGVRVLGPADLPAGAALDPAKLTVAVPAGGRAAARLLQRDWGIQAEAAGLDWLTFLITPFHTDDELGRLENALAAGARSAPEGAIVPWPLGIPESILSPKTASLSPRRRLPLDRAVGLVAAEPLCPYPPGIPLVWPGEVIGEEAVRYLRATLDAGGTANGFDPLGLVAVAEA